MLLNSATDVFIGNERVKRLTIGEKPVWSKHKFRAIKEMIDWGFIKNADSYNSNEIRVHFFIPKYNFVGFSVNPLVGDWIFYNLRLARIGKKVIFEGAVTNSKLIVTRKADNLAFIQKRINGRYYVFFVDEGKYEFVNVPAIFSCRFTLGGMAEQSSFKAVEEYNLQGIFGDPISFHALTEWDDVSQEFLKELEDGVYDDQL